MNSKVTGEGRDLSQEGNCFMKAERSVLILDFSNFLFLIVFLITSGIPLGDWWFSGYVNSCSPWDFSSPVCSLTFHDKDFTNMNCWATPHGASACNLIASSLIGSLFIK